MEWTFLLLTLIAAVLIGYIMGKGSMRLAPPTPIDVISPIKKKTKRTKHHTHTEEQPAADAAAASDSDSSKAAATAGSASDASPSPTSTESPPPTANAAAATNTNAALPPDSPTTRDRRSSSVDSYDEDVAEGRRSHSHRIVIVAKQLPILTRPNAQGRFVKEDPVTGEISLENSEWEDNRSFLSGLRALREDGFNVTWVGVPNTGGPPVPRDEQEEYEELLAQQDCVPVFLSPDIAEKHFNGFCKGVLWPMLHYVLPQSNQQFSAQWDDLWQAYNAANAAFSTVISRCVETPRDTIWVHNYHLLLLPSLLRRKLPHAKIGLFIHTPFPSSDVFRVLPTRHNILSSIMAADLLGFHTFDYARHFLSCIKRVMDLDFETLPGGSLGIKYAGRFVSILISHVGIDSTMFLETREDRCATLPMPADGKSVADEIAALRAKYGARRIIVSAGDLDSVKGGLLKFQAYARFFNRFPQWQDQVVFVEMLLPNRSVKMDHLQDLKEALEDQVAEIHSKHGKECLDVLYLKEVLPLRKTIALYAAADVCIFSGCWEGLSLFPFEYTASQRDQTNPGALIISEFMGCSRALSGVLRVNPWNLDDVAESLHAALTLSPNERIVNHQRRYKYVMDHTILRWAQGFLQHLDRATKLCEGMNYVQVGWGSNVKLVGLRSDFTHLEEELVTQAYRRAERRVLLLDYDGTLTPAEKTATKSRLMGPSKQVKKLLHSLTSDPDNIVFIMSGRTRSTLAEWFPSSEFPELGLAAEKGLFLRFPGRLTFLCRQDIRRDAQLRKRVEQRVQQKRLEQEAAAQPATTGNGQTKTLQSPNESRSQAFLSSVVKKLAESVDESKEDDSSSHADDPAPVIGSNGDAYLLVEQDTVPVDDTEWEYMIALDDVSWKAMALEIIRSYTEQTDGSWIENKEFAIVWHYEQADPEYGRMQCLVEGTLVSTVDGPKSVESIRRGDRLIGECGRIVTAHEDASIRVVQPTNNAIKGDANEIPHESPSKQKLFLISTPLGHYTVTGDHRVTVACRARFNTRPTIVTGVDGDEHRQYISMRWWSCNAAGDLELHQQREPVDCTDYSPCDHEEEVDEAEEPNAAFQLTLQERDQMHAYQLATQSTCIDPSSAFTQTDSIDTEEEEQFLPIIPSTPSVDAIKGTKSTLIALFSRRQQELMKEYFSSHSDRLLLRNGLVVDLNAASLDHYSHQLNLGKSGDHLAVVVAPNTPNRANQTVDIHTGVARETNQWMDHNGEWQNGRPDQINNTNIMLQLYNPPVGSGFSSSPTPFLSVSGVLTALNVDAAATAGLVASEINPTQQNTHIHEYDHACTKRMVEAIKAHTQTIVAFGWYTHSLWLTAARSLSDSDLTITCVSESRPYHGCVSGVSVAYTHLGTPRVLQVWFAPHIGMSHKVEGVMLAMAAATKRSEEIVQQARREVRSQMPSMTIQPVYTDTVVNTWGIAIEGSHESDKRFALHSGVLTHNSAELQKYLVKVLADPSVDVVRYDYNRILEVKPHGVSKGLAATAILEELFMMHNEKMKNSRPPSPTLGGIEEGREATGFRSNRSSHNNLASLASNQTSPTSAHSRSTSNSVFQPTSASTLPPFLFCVGDDRSDEDMFLSVQNKDYLECKLRSGVSHSHLLSHQHSQHALTSLPSQESSLRRTMSASNAMGQNQAHKRDATQTLQARQGNATELDEKTARERRKTRIADPFTFTVCVGMKPSNAHYYLHDDEEVVRLLTALGTSSQRMAQTRAADNQALANPAISPPNTITGKNFPTQTLTSVNTSRGGAAGAFALRPADIPTSPPLNTSTMQANYAASSSLKKQHGSLTMPRNASLVNRPRQVGPPPAESEDEEEDDDDDDDDDVDEEEAEFLRQKASQKKQLGGGFRRTM